MIKINIYDYLFNLPQTTYACNISQWSTLLQSSDRLSDVINKIVELQKYEHERKKDNHICVGIMLLILVMFIAAFSAFICFIYYLIR
ncbi:unnamed protein product [Rotaria sordida]|uniref:Uncharacterized protein n=1 Tax=Rotaria sordida TaxID=392033 RepID=A0A820LLD3_9BILA|nr:unnamed protein product [Rotaria sordida]CAF4359291.1 unnamed protein product [Rotaria sordida]